MRSATKKFSALARRMFVLRLCGMNLHEFLTTCIDVSGMSIGAISRAADCSVLSAMRDGGATERTARRILEVLGFQMYLGFARDCGTINVIDGLPHSVGSLPITATFGEQLAVLADHCDYAPADRPARAKLWYTARTESLRWTTVEEVAAAMGYTVSVEEPRGAAIFEAVRKMRTHACRVAEPVSVAHLSLDDISKATVQLLNVGSLLRDAT